MSSSLDGYACINKGVISCYDRVIIQGTLPGICHAADMTSLVKSRNIRVFDHTK